MAIQVLRILVLVLLSTIASAHLQCEDLRPEECAFAVASSGARCNLETYPGKNGEVMYECQTSMVMAEAKEEYIESSECISACGVERMTIGLSTDILMEKKFMESLCSPDCVEECPNIFDLYIKLAAGEGLYLPQICKSQPVKPRKQRAGRKEATNMKVMENPRAMGKPFGKPGPIWKNVWKGTQQSAQVNPPVAAPPHWWNRGHGIWDTIPPISSHPNPRSWSSSPTPPWPSSPTSPQYPPNAEAPSSSRGFNYQPHNTPQPWSPYPSPSESPSSSFLPLSPSPSPSPYLSLSPSPSPNFGMPTTIVPPSPSPFSEPTAPSPSPSPSELPSPSESPLPSEFLAPSPSENLSPSPSEALPPSPSFSSNSKDFFFQFPPYQAPSLSPQSEFPSPNSFPPTSPSTPPSIFQAPSPPPHFIPNLEAPTPANASIP